MSFANLAALRDATLLVREHHKIVTTTGSGNNMISLWTTGGAPGAESEPATTPGTVHSQEGIFFPSTGSVKKFLRRWQATIDHDSNVFLYDRLWSCSGVSLTSTGDKTINSSALTRYTDGANVEVLLEVTSTINGNVTLSVSDYTNEAGTTSRAGASYSISSSANARARAIHRIGNLAAGDRGVRAIAKINVSATAASTGDCNIVLAKRIAQMQVRGVVGGTVSGYAYKTHRKASRQYCYNGRTHSPGRFEQIYDGASLMFVARLILPNTNRNIRGVLEVSLDG